MPEGDTIHQIAGYMAPKIEGRRIRSGQAPRNPEVALGGQRVKRVRAHGKNLFMELDDGHTVRTHLGLHGSWHRYSVDEPWRKPRTRASLFFEIDDDVYVCFSAREVEWLRTSSVRDRIIATRLGPDLIAAPPDLGEILRRARAFGEPDAPMVDVLLDQRIAAGIGNVYKSELLFLERISPRAELQAVADAALVALYEKASRLLRRNLGGGARATRFDENGRGSLWVYRRQDQPCLRCDTPIRMETMGATQRSTYYCPRCQP